MRERARLQVPFAEGFDVYAQYKEFPYVIRSWRADERCWAESAVRGAPAIESRLSYHRAIVPSENVAAGRFCKILLDQVRTVAGEPLKAAASEDRDMVISCSLISLGALTDHEDQYLNDFTSRLDQLKPAFFDR